MQLLQTSVSNSCSWQSISVPDLFHATVTDFRSMQLFQTKYFRFSSVPCICSWLPFHTTVPDKVFPFQICFMQLFHTSVPCSCSRQSISVPDLFHATVTDFRSMQLFQTKYFRFSSVPCICSWLPFHTAVPDKEVPFQIRSMQLLQTSVPYSYSRQSISVPDLFHATVTDFRFIQLFQTKYFRSRSVPCNCYRLPFHTIVPDKVFPFQICSMQLLQTSVSYSCSWQSISDPDLFRAPVPCSVPFPIPFQSVYHSIVHPIPCSVPGFSNRLSDQSVYTGSETITTRMPFYIICMRVWMGYND